MKGITYLEDTIKVVLKYNRKKKPLPLDITLDLQKYGGKTEYPSLAHLTDNNGHNNGHILNGHNLF